MTPIVKARIEQLIVNWGYCQSGGGVIPGGLSLHAGHDSRDEPRMPLIVGEARITDRALRRLTMPQQSVLKVHYLTSLRRVGVVALEETSRDAQDDATARIGDQASRKAGLLELSRATFYRLLGSAQKTFWNEFKCLSGRREAPPCIRETDL